MLPVVENALIYLAYHDVSELLHFSMTRNGVSGLFLVSYVQLAENLQKIKHRTNINIAAHYTTSCRTARVANSIRTKGEGRPAELSSGARNFLQQRLELLLVMTLLP